VGVVLAGVLDLALNRWFGVVGHRQPSPVFALPLLWGVIMQGYTAGAVFGRSLGGRSGV
jgi:hypothetical protein